jgi:hypothetical protein
MAMWLLCSRIIFVCFKLLRCFGQHTAHHHVHLFVVVRWCTVLFSYWVKHWWKIKIWVKNSNWKLKSRFFIIWMLIKLVHLVILWSLVQLWLVVECSLQPQAMKWMQYKCGKNIHSNLKYGNFTIYEKLTVHTTYHVMLLQKKH